jgi:nucleoside phosphorylase/DNA-binding response OmpR family regulator
MVARILVVDDEPEWQEQLSDILVIFGHVVDKANGFHQAKDLFEKNGYDIAIVDIALGPSVNRSSYIDFELVCKGLQQSKPSIPIIALSGKPIAPEFMFTLGNNNTVDKFISKSDPFFIATLEGMLKRLLKSNEQDIDEDLHYSAEDQPWFLLEFPKTSEIGENQADQFQGKINLVLITATEVELKASVRLLKPFPGRKRILKLCVGPETYYLGKFGAYITAVTKCRIGAINEGSVILATEQAQRIWNPIAVIMVGIAFGKDPGKQKIGDVLVASQIISYEQQRVGKDIVYRGPIVPNNTTLLNRFENIFDWTFMRPDGKKCDLMIGPILSGEKLIDDLDFKQKLFDQFPQAIGGEMEGAGLCAATGRFGTPWLLVKSICDWGDGKKHNKHQQLAAAAAVSLVYHVLSQKTVLDALQ